MQEGAGHKLAAAGAAGQEVGGYADASTGSGSTISGLEFPRYFTTAGVDPFDEVEWELRDAVIGSERGKVVFEQRGVEMPKPSVRFSRSRSIAWATARRTLMSSSGGFFRFM